MVVGNVLSHQSVKVTLVEDEGVIEQFATRASDPALCDTVLPRASEGRPRWVQAEGIHRCEDPVAEYRVSVEDQMAHGGIMRTLRAAAGQPMRQRAGRSRQNVERASWRDRSRTRHRGFGRLRSEQ